MASPFYGIDVVALAVAVVLAAAIVLLAYQVVPDLTDLMMMPPPLSGDGPASPPTTAQAPVPGCDV